MSELLSGATAAELVACDVKQQLQRLAPASSLLLPWHASLQNLRRKLKHCYKNSGVNHQQECRELALAYLESIKGVGVYRANSGPNDAPSECRGVACWFSWVSTIRSYANARATWHGGSCW